MAAKFVWILLSFIVINFTLNGQDSTFIKTKFNGDIGQYFGPKLTFPTALAFQGIVGFGEVEFRVNKQGKIDSINIITAPHVQMGQNIASLLLSTKDMWNPTLQNGQPIDYKYKLIVEYKITKRSGPPPQGKAFALKDKAIKMNMKKKYVDALELIDEAISINPYQYEFYDLRSQILQSLGNTEGSILNRQKSENLKKQIVAQIMVVKYGVVK